MGDGAQTAGELVALRKSVNRGAPYGLEDWTMRIANILRLEFTLHPRGRPRREKHELLEKVCVPFSLCPQQTRPKLDELEEVESNYDAKDLVRFGLEKMEEEYSFPPANDFRKMLT